MRDLAFSKPKSIKHTKWLNRRLPLIYSKLQISFVLLNGIINLQVVITAIGRYIKFLLINRMFYRSSMIAESNIWGKSNVILV